MGNTDAHKSGSRQASVHPHACGEHRLATTRDQHLIGSSPRMWGTLQLPIEPFYSQRFIPTHVGNTSKIAADISVLSVHPHACGEHKTPPAKYSQEGGSSPRMWGTRVTITTISVSTRFIPTHVGNTGVCVCCPSDPTVHPHACGEHPERFRYLMQALGSSPRMWGTPTIWMSCENLRRFIPTHVGNTSICRKPNFLQTVHPHACGEHGVDAAREDIDDGSSPRMWGTQRNRRPVTQGMRFIPTHVGNTSAKPNGQH